MNFDGSSKVSELKIKEGDSVKKEQVLFILTTENHWLEYKAEDDCIIYKIYCKQGSTVMQNELLLETKPINRKQFPF